MLTQRPSLTWVMGHSHWLFIEPGFYMSFTILRYFQKYKDRSRWHFSYVYKYTSKVHLKYEVMKWFINSYLSQHPCTITNMSHATNPPTFRHFQSEWVGVFKNTYLSNICCYLKHRFPTRNCTYLQRVNAEKTSIGNLGIRTLMIHMSKCWHSNNCFSKRKEVSTKNKNDLSNELLISQDWIYRISSCGISNEIRSIHVQLIISIAS